MADYHSSYTGAQIDDAIGRALPTGELSTGKQNKITVEGIPVFDGEGNATPATIDSTPTASSENLVTSGGVKSALDEKVAKNYYAPTVSTTGWTHDQTYDCYYKNISNSFFSASDTLLCDLLVTEAEDVDAKVEAWSKIFRITVGSNYCRLYASEVPSESFNMQIVRLR